MRMHVALRIHILDVLHWFLSGDEPWGSDFDYLKQVAPDYLNAVLPSSGLLVQAGHINHAAERGQRQPRSDQLQVLGEILGNCLVWYETALGEAGTAAFAHDGWALIYFHCKRFWRQSYPINNVQNVILLNTFILQEKINCHLLSLFQVIGNTSSGPML